MLCFRTGNVRSQNCTMRRINIHLSDRLGSWRGCYVCLHVYITYAGSLVFSNTLIKLVAGLLAHQRTEKPSATWFPSCPTTLKLTYVHLLGRSKITSRAWQCKGVGCSCLLNSETQEGTLGRQCNTCRVSLSAEIRVRYTSPPATDL